MTGWDWVTVAGISLDVVGTCVAIVGVWQLAVALDVPWRGWPGRMWRRLRRKPRTIEVEGVTFGGSGSVGLGRVRVVKPRPRSYDSMDTVLEYFEQQLEFVREDQEAERVAREAQEVAIRAEATDRADTERRHVDEQLSGLNLALAGERGRGLLVAMLGLSLTALGAVVQVVAVAGASS